MRVNRSKSSAVVVGDFRYELRRAWNDTSAYRDEGDPPAIVAWVMLNPSTADAMVDDATIRRCVNYSADWGYDGLVVVNLYAWRARDPRRMIRAIDAHAKDTGRAFTLLAPGPENDTYIRDALAESAIAVCGWGAKVNDIPGGLERAAHVESMIREYTDPLALNVTKDGHPWHPCYLPSDLRPRSLDELRRDQGII